MKQMRIFQLTCPIYFFVHRLRRLYMSGEPGMLVELIPTWERRKHRRVLFEIGNRQLPF
jgi:hypothetical protein